MKKIFTDLQTFFLFLYLFFLSFFNYTPFYLISGILLIIVTFLIVVHRKKVILTQYFWFELFFIGYNLMYALMGLSINYSHTMSALKTVVLNLVINLAIMNTITKKEDIREILNWFVPITLFACFYIVIYTGGTGNNGRLAQGVSRPFSTTPYTSMNFASWALYASVIATINYFEKNEKKNLFYIIIFWIVIIWAGSRKWIAAGILLESATYLLYSSKKINWNKFVSNIFKISIVLCILMILLFKNSTLYNIAGYRFVGYINRTESSAISRDTMKRIAIEYGLNTFRDVSIYHNWSESNYLELAFGNGIWMAVLYYLFLLIVANNLYKLRKKDKFNLILMMIIMMFIIFDTVSMSYSDRLSTFFITISSMAVFLNKKEARKNNDK